MNILSLSLPLLFSPKFSDQKAINFHFAIPVHLRTEIIVHILEKKTIKSLN